MKILQKNGENGNGKHTAHNIGFAKWRVKEKIKVCAFLSATAFYISFFLILVNIKKLLLKLVQN